MIHSKCTKSTCGSNNIELVASNPTSSPSHKDPRFIFTPALPHLPEDHANLPLMEKKLEDLLNHEKDVVGLHHADNSGGGNQKEEIREKIEDMRCS